MEIPGYKIIDTLGEGGMATVYLAIQESFEREVALKVMSPQLSKDPSFGERFIREARIVSRLMHPNIVTVYDVGVHEGNHYLSMEYVPGHDLKVNRYNLDLDVALAIVKDVAKALDYAGRKGYVHRDVKPENIMIHGEDGRAVLMDFGIARASDVASGMTQTGTTMGTPHYMSPEQAKGAKVDPRSDLYSLGVVLFQLVCGYVPFDADSAVAVGIMHVSDAIPDLPEHLAVFQPIINRALAKKPDQRYQNGAEFIADLDALPRAEIEKVKHQLALKPQIDEIEESAATVVSAPIANTRVDTEEVARATRDDDMALSGDESFSVQGDDGIGDRPKAPTQTSRRSWWSAVITAGVIGGGGWFGWQYLGASSPQNNASDALKPQPVAAISASGESVSEPTDVKALIRGEPVDEKAGSEAGTANIAPAGALAANSDSAGSDDSADIAGASTQSSAAPRPAAGAEALFAEFEQDASVAPELAALYNQMLLSADAASVAAAEQGLAAMQASIAARFDSAVADANLAEARQLAELSADLFPDTERDAGLSEAVERLAGANEIASTLAEAEAYLQRDALSSPPGANALASYRSVLERDPDNTEALAGLDKIAARYYELGGEKVAVQEFEAALAMVERGLKVQPENEALRTLQSEIADAQLALKERQSTIASLDAKAQEQMSHNQLITPSGNSAFDTYQQLLEQVPEAEDVAEEGLFRVEQGLINRIDQLIQDKNVDEALLQLDNARDHFPQSEGLLALRLQLDRLLEELQPKIATLRLATQAMTDISAPQAETLSPGRIIHVGFEYANFSGETTVIQAVLMDGSRSVQIAQKPVIVSGTEGIKFFAIERPVAGFGKGAYHVDLSLADDRLATISFKVAE
ncbi:protein kinase [Gilvimarinus sp. SDUM040013]|uniref:Protein kinase n=1 Tax=Gilvimarinus gilvus TaxID=3058038 RepID=A0ABU4RW54_9GAMM|nr:protein kinase [Gilvimarinus sp. SDUM040013]MDO3386528.1 protein kinase [Gilvimarinus sp. SDUM040013]MDX6849104.1 protein kinase [Gilvimarinus sp. SDUM040013]